MTRIRMLRGARARWESLDYVLGDGEPGHVTDDGVMLVGDGVSTYSQLIAAGTRVLARAVDLRNLATDLRNLADVVAGKAATSDLAAYARRTDLGRRVRLSAYCTGDGSDESAKLQQAITATLNAGGTLDCDVPGVIGCKTTVTLGDERPNALQRSLMSVTGTLRVVALAPMDTLLRLSGTITVTANIEADAAGLAMFGVYGKNYGRTTYGRVQSLNALTSALAGEPSGNNNAWTIEKIRAHGSGTKITTTAKVTARSSESGWASTGDDAPYTTWTLDNPLPPALTCRPWAAPAVLFSDRRVMQVRRVVDATTVEVFNENRPIDTTDTLTLASAAIAFPYFGDVGVWKVGHVDVRDNPNAWALNYGGYGGYAGMWAQQNNYGGILILKKAMGLGFGSFYNEKSGSSGQGTPWAVVRDVANTVLNVGPGTNSEPGNWQGMSLAWQTLEGRNRQPLHWFMQKGTGSPLTMPPAAPIDPPELNPGTRNLTPGTAQAYRRTSGAYAFRIDNNGAPTGVGHVKLEAPTTGGGTALTVSLLNGNLGHTIEGAATFSRTFLTSVEYEYWLEGTDWRFRPLAATKAEASDVAAALAGKANASASLFVPGEGAGGAVVTGSWAIPPGAVTLTLETVNGGGGGGSGRRGAAGTVRCGGGGGAAGSLSQVTVRVADLPPGTSTLYYMISPPGAGAPAVTTDDTDGQAGGTQTGVTQIALSPVSTNSIASALVMSWYGSQSNGKGGTATGGAAGTATDGTQMTASGGAASATGGSGAPGVCTSGNNWGPSGGGAGGGITSTNTASRGGGGGYICGTSRGTTNVVGDGVPAIPVVQGSIGTGAGGGNSSLTAAGGNGGRGGDYGGGGGGGAASVNGYPSGAGGNGGRGYIKITARG